MNFVQCSVSTVVETKMSKNHQKRCRSNWTNSNLAADLKSRVFVGNLNTKRVCKRTLVRIFSRCGFVKGVSIHQGFAFVQFSSASSAMSAIKVMNRLSLAGRQIEVKLAGNKTQSIDIDSASSDGAYSQTFQQMPSTNFNWNSLLNPTLFYSFQHPIDSFVSFETSVVQAQSNQ